MLFRRVMCVTKILVRTYTHIRRRRKNARCENKNKKCKNKETGVLNGKKYFWTLLNWVVPLGFEFYSSACVRPVFMGGRQNHQQCASDSFDMFLACPPSILAANGSSLYQNWLHLEFALFLKIPSDTMLQRLSCQIVSMECNRHKYFFWDELI